MTPKKDCGNLDECKVIFVSWQWEVVFIGGFIALLGGLAWAGGSKVTTLERDIQETKAAIDQITTINHKLDTLIKLTR